MTQRQKNNLITIIAIVVIGVAGYIGFSPLFAEFKDGVTSEFLAAIFGTIFTIMLTMFLLNKQTEIEEEKSRGESVFNERVELYKQVIDQMNNIVEDGEISITEMNKLQFMLVKLQMVAEDTTIQKFTKVYDAVSTAFSREREDEEDNENSDETKDSTPIEPDDKIAILESMLEFSQSCRVELGLASSDKINKDLFAKTTESLKQSQKAVEEKKMGGTRAEVNLAFRDILPDLVKRSKYFNKDMFKDVVTLGYPDPARDFYLNLLDKNENKNYWATLNLYPSEDGKTMRFRYQYDITVSRITDDYEGSGLKALVDEATENLKKIEQKYNNLLKPDKKHLQVTLTRDKRRRIFYYQTKTEFKFEDFNKPDFQQRLTDHIIEVGQVFYELQPKVENILVSLGTSLKTIYQDSRVGLKDDKNSGEGEELE